MDTRCDPTAHAEIPALRAACAELGRPELSDAVLYANSEPCPVPRGLPLGSDQPHRVRRVVYAASLEDTALSGFEDAHYYRRLTLPWSQRALPGEPGDAVLYEEAVAVPRTWHTR